MRGADPAIVLVPGVGMFSFGADAQTARVAGEFYLNAINVMRGAEAVSAYQPIPESEKFRIEYWELEEAKLRRRPQAEAAGRADRAGHRGRFRHRPGHRAAARRRGRLRGRGRPRRRLGPAVRRVGRRAGLAGRRRGGDRGRDRRGRGGGRVRRGRTGLRRRGPRGQQRGPVHLQAAAGDDPGRLGPPARRDGPRLVPGLPPGRQGHDGPGDGRRHRLHLQQERGLRRAVQRGLRRGQGRPGAPGPAAGRRARRASASG